MCHAADDADTDRGERISAIRNIHGKEAGYGTCETESSGDNIPLIIYILEFYLIIQFPLCAIY